MGKSKGDSVLGRSANGTSVASCNMRSHTSIGRCGNFSVSNLRLRASIYKNSMSVNRLSRRCRIYLVDFWPFDIGVEFDMGWVRFWTTDLRGHSGFEQSAMRRQSLFRSRPLSGPGRVTWKSTPITYALSPFLPPSVSPSQSPVPVLAVSASPLTLEQPKRPVKGFSVGFWGKGWKDENLHR